MDVRLTDNLTRLLAMFFFATMFALAFLSMKDDALTFDELAHIPAGYSYLTQQDYRINPEHPPLAKDLAAFPLLFLNLNFPEQSQNWLQEQKAPPWWVQFDLGREFLYQSGNNPREIIMWSRLPMIALFLAAAWFLFFWARKLAGNASALVALALFSFSPTLLSHGRLVTTDLAAAFGAMVATYFWLLFLKEPSKKHVLVAGIVLGFAMLLKFSLVLLIPFFALLTLLYPLLHVFSWKKLREYAAKAVFAGIIGLVLVIWPVYAWHTANYPADRQLRDTISDLSPSGIFVHERAVIEMTKVPLLRPLAQYARGVAMTLQRSAFGNTTYFQGQISSSGWWEYFPVIYLLKEPLAFHVLNFLVISGFSLLVLFAMRKIKSTQGFLKSAVAWIRQNFTVVALLLFVNLYWALAASGNLNIGVRHLLPIFPFSYILVAWGILFLLNRAKQKLVFGGIVGILLVWYVSSSLLAFPNYLSFYNELGGGTSKGYKVAVDSNYDWGQDFYRLVEYVQDHDIQKLSLDYFGGEYPPYWLGQRYEKLDPQNPPEKGWVAVSVNQLMGGIAKPAKGFDQPTGYYNWLKDKEPAAKAGNSIFIYYLD